MRLATEKFAKVNKKYSNCKDLKSFTILETQKFEFLPIEDGWNTLYSVVFLDDLLNQFKIIVGFSTAWKANLTAELLTDEQYSFILDYFGEIQVCIQIRNLIYEYSCETSWCIC